MAGDIDALPAAASELHGYRRSCRYNAARQAKLLLARLICSICGYVEAELCEEEAHVIKLHGRCVVVDDTRMQLKTCVAQPRRPLPTVRVGNAVRHQ